MVIHINKPVKAQPLDDEGDPVGQQIELPAGQYRLRSGLTQHDDGTLSCWASPANDDRLFILYGLAKGTYPG